MTNTFAVKCEYIDADHPLDVYVRGYLAKRRDDSEGVTRDSDGSVTYTLGVAFPAWLRRIVTVPRFAFTETVRYNKGDAMCAVRAVCVEAEATITKRMEGHAGGTRVHCTVEVVPEFRGVPVPRFAIKTFIQNRFRQERARDTTYARIVQAKRRA